MKSTRKGLRDGDLFKDTYERLNCADCEKVLKKRRTIRTKCSPSASVPSAGPLLKSCADPFSELDRTVAGIERHRVPVFVLPLLLRFPSSSRYSNTASNADAPSGSRPGGDVLADVIEVARADERSGDPRRSARS